MSISNVLGIERYQQHQTLGNNLSALQSTPGAGVNGTPDEQEIDELFTLSDRQQKVADVASHFRITDINFPEVLTLRQTLYDQGLIDLQDANTLTLATQVYPDHARFNLTEALEKYQGADSNLYLSFSLGRLTTLSANLEAAGTQ